MKKSVVLLFFIFSLNLLIFFLNSVSAETGSCCCRSWGGGIDCASSENSFCGSSGLPNGVYSFLQGLGSSVCNTNFRGDNFYFTKNCGEYGEGCWSYLSCIGYKTGSCGGKCFDRETEKCCSDKSGLICKKSQYCGNADINRDGKVDWDNDYLSMQNALLFPYSVPCDSGNNFCDYNDINKDGKVNMIDESLLKLWIGCHRTDSSSASAAPYCCDTNNDGLSDTCSDIECNMISKICPAEIPVCHECHCDSSGCSLINSEDGKKCMISLAEGITGMAVSQKTEGVCKDGECVAKTENTPPKIEGAPKAI